MNHLEGDGRDILNEMASRKDMIHLSIVTALAEIRTKYNPSKCQVLYFLHLSHPLYFVLWNWIRLAQDRVQ
jgi:hypothetical protein